MKRTLLSAMLTLATAVAVGSPSAAAPAERDGRADARRANLGRIHLRGQRIHRRLHRVDEAARPGQHREHGKRVLRSDRHRRENHRARNGRR